MVAHHKAMLHPKVVHHREVLHPTVVHHREVLHPMVDHYREMLHPKAAHRRVLHRRVARPKDLHSPLMVGPLEEGTAIDDHSIDWRTAVGTAA